MLFDRLIDNDPESKQEVRPFRALSVQELKDSVRRELSRLLNSRCPIPGSALEGMGGMERTVINYGIPDFTSYSPQNANDQSKLAKSMRQAIEAFEPRLTNVDVTVDPLLPNERTVSARIEAVLIAGTVREPVMFPILMNRDSRG